MKTATEYSREWRAKNRDRYNELMRTWRANNPERAKELNTENNAKRKRNGIAQLARRKWHLKKQYGLTLEQYDEKLAAQNGLCAICKQKELSIRRGTYKSLDVDHNHATGEVRGLLCSACNAALGLLQEDPTRIMALLDYLKVWNG